MHHFELCLETTVIDFPLVVASDWLLRIFLERWNYVRRPVWGILLSPSKGRAALLNLEAHVTPDLAKSFSLE